MQRILAPSILSADFGHLDRVVHMLDRSAAEWVHIDVMDGIFVPNISFGFPVLNAVRKATRKVLDVHLMIVEPEKYVQRFAEAGADMVTFHLEACADPARCIASIRESGARVGITIKPATPVETVRKWLPSVDMVLIMSVEPGFGGQRFIPASFDKIRELRRMAAESNPALLVEVDGGITRENAPEVYAAGADVLVTGNAVFGAEDPERAIAELLQL
ncbi:MAG: ribulose-phosphate 3-epimerase [Alistipes sp.]|nr:ribulose-phosphate 3-epimerase [Alistipes sp.]